MKNIPLSLILIIAVKMVSKTKSYWIHKKASCHAIETTANNSTPIEINSTDCTAERSVICKLDLLKAQENAAPTIPPKFPCILSNQGVTNKRKREVESIVQGGHDKPKDGKCKKEYEIVLHQRRKLYYDVYLSEIDHQSQFFLLRLLHWRKWGSLS